MNTTNDSRNPLTMFFLFLGGLILGGLGGNFIGTKIIGKEVFPESFIPYDPDVIIPPIQELVDQERMEFVPGVRLGPGFVGESHGGGSGNGGPRGINPRGHNFNLLANGAAEITSFFYVTLPDTLINKQGDFDVLFSYFKDRERTTPQKMSTVFERKSGVKRFAGNPINVDNNDFLEMQGERDYVNFSVTLVIEDFSNLNDHHIVMEISDHHSSDKNGVEIAKINDRIRFLIPNSIMSISDCRYGSELDRLECEDNSGTHRAEHVEVTYLNEQKINVGI